MDLYIAKAYSHKRNEWARYVVGHSSQDLAEDLVRVSLDPGFKLDSIRITTPLPAGTKPFIEEV